MQLVLGIGDLGVSELLQWHLIFVLFVQAHTRGPVGLAHVVEHSNDAEHSAGADESLVVLLLEFVSPLVLGSLGFRLRRASLFFVLVN